MTDEPLHPYDLGVENPTGYIQLPVYNRIARRPGGVVCPACNDTGHVCENHPDKLWGGICCGRPPTFTGMCEHGACHCGGAGMPCAACCSPIPEDGSTPIGMAFTPDWRRG